MHQLTFQRVSEDLHIAAIDVHDYDGIVHGQYLVRTTPALSLADPFRRWRAESPDGFIIDEAVTLIEAMRACEADLISYQNRIAEESLSVTADPMLETV